jgi:hypothetical protein
MKKLLLLIFYPFCLLAQFNDDFSTLENWTGDTDKFEKDSIEQLHLSAEALTDKAIIWRISNALINRL